MDYPKTLAEAMSKVNQLFQDDSRLRGVLRAHLVHLPESVAVGLFQDDDIAVRSCLEALAQSGELSAGRGAKCTIQGLPLGAGLTETMAAQLAEIHADLHNRRSVALSGVNLTKWEQIREHSRLEVEVWEEPMQPCRKLKSADKVPLFGWTDALEKTQAERYGPHIQQCISTPGDVQWIDAANRYPLLLETAKGRVLPFTLRGTTDYAAVTRAANLAAMPLLGLRVLFELKKVIEPGTVYQAMAQLLVANMHAPTKKPVVVLTDLRDDWHIYWMDGNKLYTYTPESRFVAVAAIEDILSTQVPSELGISSFASTSDETKGTSRLLKRRKFVQPEEGGGGLYGQLTELAGLLPEDEYKAALMESVVQQFSNIPAVAAMRPVPTGMYC